jgi:cystathionine beta-synthase
VAVMPDSGSRYLSKMFNDEWMRDNQFLERTPRMGRVRDLLLQRDRHGLIAAQKNERVDAVIARMKSYGISQLPVIEENHVLGLVEERDLLNFMLSGIGFPASEIASIVHNDVPTVSEDSALDDVSAIFTHSPNEAVIVTRNDTPEDIITKIDLIDFLVKNGLNAVSPENN